MNMKKALITALAFAVLVSTAAPAAAVDDPVQGIVANPVEQVSQEYSVTSAFVQNELAKGYSLQDVTQALKISQITGDSYQTVILNQNPQPINNSQQAFSQVESEGVVLNNLTEDLYQSGAEGAPAPSVEPPVLGDKVSEAPYSVSLSDANISTLTGSLSIEQTDLTLPGRNGLNFSLIRRYNSSDAQFYDMDTSTRTVPDYAYKVSADIKHVTQARGYQVSWKVIKYVQLDKNGDGNPDENVGSVGSETKTSSTLYTRAEVDAEVNAVANKTYPPDPWKTQAGGSRWRYIYNVDAASARVYATNSTKTVYTSNGVSEYGPYNNSSDAEVKRQEIIGKNGNIAFSGGWEGDATYKSVRDQIFFADIDPLIEQFLIGQHRVYNNKLVKSYQEKLYPIGAGWSWAIPSVEMKSDKKYIHMSDGGSYEVSGTNLKGYPWKNLEFKTDTNVSVNGEKSTYLLSSILDGTKTYFNADGRVIQISDAYGNNVQFKYTTHNVYGKVLTSITNSTGNSINISYSKEEVRITQGDKTIVYAKGLQKDVENKEVLNSVTDPAGRKTTFLYHVRNASFNLLGSRPEMANPYALLINVQHPTGAATNYQYEENAITRYIASSAVNQAYRIRSVENQMSLSNNTTSTHGRHTFTYTNDIGSTYDKDLTISTEVDNGLLKTTYEHKKDYIDANTPTAYYNTKLTKTAADQQNVTTMTYDETRRLSVPLSVTTQVFKNGSQSQTQKVTKSYDDYGNLLTETNPLGTTTSYAYDSTTHLLSSITEPISTSQTRKTEYTRNSAGSITQTKVTDGANTLLQQLQYDYDSYGNVVIVRATDDNRTIKNDYEYSALYQYAFPTKWSTQVTDADGVQSTITKQYEYDLKTGLMTKFTDGKGNVNQYGYDMLGRMIQETHPDGTKTTLTYKDLENQVEATDENGMKSVVKWNPLGEQIETGLLDGTTYKTRQKYGYDKNGRNIWVEDAIGARTTNVYDAWDRVIETRYADGSNSTVRYDDVLYYVTRTDADGAAIRETFDLLGRSIRTDQLKATGTQTLEEVTYNDKGDKLTSRDAKGQVTKYSYDVLQHLVSVVDPEGTQTKYAYDKLGNLIKTTYADGKSLQKEYDELGRTKKRIDELGQIDTYYYDANNNPIKQIDRKGQVLTSEYNNRGFLVKKTAGNEAVTYQYDPTGKRTQMIDQTGSTKYAYTLTGNLASITTQDGRTMTYSYDANDNRVSMKDPFDRKIFYKTDVLNRLTNISVDSENAPAEATYSYTKSGPLQKVMQRNGMVFERIYDEEQNLKTLVQKNSDGIVQNSYENSYDANRNLTSRNTNGQTATFSYDALDRIKSSSMNSENYTYDSRGNRQTLESDRKPANNDSTYEYDPWNRLSKVTTADGTVVLYQYNGDGLLYERTENAVTTRFYYDKEHVIAEATVGSGEVLLTARYIRGLALVGREGADGKKVYYSHNDHNDITEVRDDAGKLLNSYGYDLWGNPTYENELVENPFRYSGEFWDNQAKLEYLRARWYDPSQGRFINEDTFEGRITNAQSLNRYVYVESNPLIYWDPSGHDKATDGEGGNGVYDDDYGIMRDKNNDIAYAFYESTVLSSKNGVDFDFLAPVVEGYQEGRIDLHAVMNRSQALGTAIFVGAMLGDDVVYGDILRPKSKKEILRENYAVGKAVEKRMHAWLGGELNPRGFKTDSGTRFFDILKDGVAYETKVGKVFKSKFIINQVLKDKFLIDRRRINRAEWHFFKNANGNIGPSGPLKTFLEENNIKIVYHDL